MEISKVFERFLIVFSLVWFHVSAGGSTTVRLYEHSHYKGKEWSVSVGSGCVNALDFNDEASSIRVSGGCVTLWEHINCEGESVNVQSPGHDNLVNLNFNDRLTSISTCGAMDNSGIPQSTEIVMHLNGANDLAEHAENMRQMMLEWFPFIQNTLYTPTYRHVSRIDVYFDVKYNGIYTSGTEIHIPIEYVRNNRGDTGVFIHELTHVIHQIRHRCPGWVVEGTAEYMRRWLYEPLTTPTKPTDPELNNDYLGDWLLAYLNTAMKRPIFYQVTRACREGKWHDNFLRELTGRDEREWWRIMVNNNYFPWKRLDYEFL